MESREPLRLPPPVLCCIETLENAGYACYVVGGCVRDALLGLTPHDYDLCTDARPEVICNLFAAYPLVRSGEKHGTIGVVSERSVYEITTFRTEGAYTDHRHPDRVNFVRDVTQDLARRDFTVNAMAYSPARGLIDPFGGRDDLQRKCLRAVGDPSRRFAEDALRILRGVRFSVRYALMPEEATMQAMVALAPCMEQLARERVFDELCKLLPLIDAQALLRFAPIVYAALPELAPLCDRMEHIARVVQAVPPELPLRWAALLHESGAETADAALLRLKAPTALRAQVRVLVAECATPTPPLRPDVRMRLSRLGAQTMERLLLLQEAHAAACAAADDTFSQVRAIVRELSQENACVSMRDLAVNGDTLLALGFRGAQIGQALRYLLTQVLQERVENEEAALLRALREHFPAHTTFGGNGI